MLIHYRKKHFETSEKVRETSVIMKSLRGRLCRLGKSRRLGIWKFGNQIWKKKSFSSVHSLYTHTHIHHIRILLEFLGGNRRKVYAGRGGTTPSARHCGASPSYGWQTPRGLYLIYPVLLIPGHESGVQIPFPLFQPFLFPSRPISFILDDFLVSFLT